MTKKDIHKYKDRINSALKRVKQGNFLKSNKEDLLEFYNYLIAEGMSIGRTAKYLNHLLKITLWLDKSFKKVTKKDIINLVRKIEMKDYSVHTKHDYKVIIKRFFRWHRNSEEYPEEVKWLKTTVKDNNSKLPEELLTEDDVEKLIKAGEHPRDKSLVSLLYESGCRIGEILSLKIKHVTFDEFGAKILVDGKTGMRKMRVVASVPFLATWVENHPDRDNPDASLWPVIGTRNKDGDISYSNVNKLIKKLAERGGINKRVNPHIFRHSRATHLANHLTEAQMNHYFGWVQGSDMPSTYVHLSGRDVDYAILKIHGIKMEEKENGMKFSPKKCHRCEKMNAPNGKFCMRCGAPLDMDTVIKVEEKRTEVDNRMNFLVNSLLKDSEMRTIIKGRLREIQIATT